MIFRLYCSFQEPHDSLFQTSVDLNQGQIGPWYNDQTFTTSILFI